MMMAEKLWVTRKLWEGIWKQGFATFVIQNYIMEYLVTEVISGKKSGYVEQPPVCHMSGQHIVKWT